MSDLSIIMSDFKKLTELAPASQSKSEKISDLSIIMGDFEKLTELAMAGEASQSKMSDLAYFNERFGDNKKPAELSGFLGAVRSIRTPSLNWISSVLTITLSPLV